MENKLPFITMAPLLKSKRNLRKLPSETRMKNCGSVVRLERSERRYITFTQRRAAMPKVQRGIICSKVIGVSFGDTCKFDR